tara:strand:+ start:11791 stop:13665 length:1875 start_codon:yes stop_codon:yes gene_type:complete
MKLVKTTFLALVSCGMTLAQNTSLDSLAVSTNYLDEVVVTDSRFALKRSQSGKTVVKINSEEIQQFSGLGLGVLLSTQLGIDVIGKNTHSGQNQTLSIRGGRNRQVLILIDGIRVSDPSRIDNDFDINLLNIEMIESIEIVKGAASSLYGSSAATGVVNITTKKSKKPLTLIAKRTWGTEQAANQALNNFNAGNQFVNLTGKLSKSGIGVNVTYAERFSDGISAVVGDEVDQFKKVNFNAALNGEIGSQFNWQLSFNKDDITSDYDNSFPLEDADFEFTTKLNRYALNAQYKYAKGSLNLNAGLQKNEREFKSSFPTMSESDNLNIDLFNKYIFNNKFYSIAGIQYQKSTMEAAENPENYQTDIYLNSVYLDPSGLNLNVGLRYNIHEAYGGHLIYSLNPSYTFDLNDNYQMKLLSSYSKAFIAPSLYQLYNPNYGNSALEPENNLSFEFGFEIRSAKNAFNVVYFDRKQNPTLIFNTTPTDSKPFGGYDNSDGEIVYRGFELAYDFELFEKAKTRLNYVFTESTDGDLRSIPKHAISGVMDIPIFTQTHLNFIGQFTGDRIANDFSELDAYSLFTFQVNHTLEKYNTNLFLSVFNVFDTEYVIIPGYQTRGRNILMGLTVQFD